jgi:DNA repair exonuclease SbcCD nuclease subunit
MKKQLFQTAACLTDIHLGLKNNSRIHLDDCNRFIDWFIAEAQARNAETCIFLGDWHHHRASINAYTLSETTRQLRKLSENFQTVYFIVGNHDLYFKENRTINSVEYARDLDNIVLVDDVLIQGDVAIVPWLVGDEWKQIKKARVKYMFGHFELPHFKMNAMVEMPDHGGLKSEHLTGPEYVFSGHFHKRQYKNNIHYIGNCFPHNYADAGDFERGAMFLTWDDEPLYVNWPDCPKYRVLALSELLDKHAELLDEYTYARVKLDIDITYEEATFIKEQFAEQYGVRELHLMPVQEEAEEFDGSEIEFESVDHIVVSQLDTIDSNTISKQTLIEIYNNLTI